MPAPRLNAITCAVQFQSLSTKVGSFLCAAAVFAASICAALPSRVLAASNSLNQIETSSALAPGKIELTGGFALPDAFGGGGEIAFLRLKAGVFRGFQVSAVLPFDSADKPLGEWIYAPESGSARFGWKYEIVEEGLERIGIAAGMTGAGASRNPEYFVAFTKHATELFGFTAGLKGNAFGVSDSPRLFAGAELNFPPGIARVMVDFQMNGSDELKCFVTGVGAAYKPAKNAEVSVKWFGITGKGLSFAAPGSPADVLVAECAITF